MRLRLHETAHDTERTEGFPVFHEKSRDDGVKGFLAGFQAVGVLFIQGEVMPAVLKRDAGSRHHQTATESHVVALDVGDHVAVLVGGGEIHCPVILEITRFMMLRVMADQRTSFFEITGL